MDISIKEIIAVSALAFAFWKYTDIRQRELRWKRTEFLFKQAEFLDNDPDINLAISVLDGADDGVKIEDLFDADGKINKSIEAFEYKSWDNVNYLLCGDGTIDPEDGYNLSPSYIRKKERKRRRR